MDKQTSLHLLKEWNIRSVAIRKLVSISTPNKRYELLGWIELLKEKLSESDLLRTLKTHNNGWESNFYKEEKEKVFLEIQHMIEPPHVEEGAYKCKKCGSKRTVHVSLQLRSQDEPMTNFITCVACNERWKE